MALVDYSDSESGDDADDDDDDESIGHDRGKEGSHSLPPLPSKFHDLYTTNARLSIRDVPSLHEGRKRSTPHVVGNWPSHVYIEWYPTPSESSKLTLLISNLRDHIPSITSSLTSNLGATLPLHISLSRSIGFLTAEKDAFLETITKSIASSNIPPFKVRFTSVDWVPNFESTRWFLVVRLETPPGNELNRLLDVCNEVVRRYGKPPLYEHQVSDVSPLVKGSKLGNPNKSVASHTKEQTAVPTADDKFHVSIAWTLTPPDEKMQDKIKMVKEFWGTELKAFHLDVKEMKVKIGNIVTGVSLSEKIGVEKGFFD